MRRFSAVLLGAFLLAGCEGPMGPAGPPGPEGEPGPGTRVVRSTTVNSEGTAAVNLPAAAGTLQDPPALTCYLAETSSGPFLVVGTDLQGPICGLGQGQSNLVALIIDAPPGWVARFVAVY